jgi:hypothetical protein
MPLFPTHRCQSGPAARLLGEAGEFPLESFGLFKEIRYEPPAHLVERIV